MNKRIGIVIFIIFLFIGTSIFPIINALNKDLVENDINVSLLSKNYQLDNNLQDILIVDNVTFNDYNDDVFCMNFGFLRGSYYRTVEKPNINIISGSYLKNKSNVTLNLEVMGEIEDKGNNISYVFIIYGFNIFTSEDSYFIFYQNRTCKLTCHSSNITENIDDYLVDGSILSVNFRLNNSFETINSMEVNAFYGYVDPDKKKFEFDYDIATNIEYSREIKITKPDNKLYLFNKKILSLSSPVIIGKINIEYEDILDEPGSSLDYRELYIDDELTATPNYLNNLIWDKLSFGKHRLKVLAFDVYGNRISDDIEVWKFF